MNILFNALSSTNLSSHHVILGHLRMLAKWSQGKHKYWVLYHRYNNNICRNLGDNVKWIECPAYNNHWLRRYTWERFKLKGVVNKLNIGLILWPTGTIAKGLGIPQISYAMNPWALVPEAGKKISGQIKAWAQRRGYKKAMQSADMMLFLSGYMRRIFQENAGCNEKASEIVYCGLDESIFEKAKQRRNELKNEYQILTVSAMAPHKGAETSLQALKRLHTSYNIPATLVMVGPWPDKQYKSKILHLVSELELAEFIQIKGKVSVEKLHDYYAKSKVFCLMSWCESFGIPSVEAQTFGTPVVSSNCCAIPEVCGKGGLYPEPGDVKGTADALAQLLTNQNKWEKFSQAAVQNANRYHWDICSKPLMKIFDTISV